MKGMVNTCKSWLNWFTKQLPVEYTVVKGK